MNIERMLDTLVTLGLTRTEAEAYLFLAKRGPHNRKELANALKLTNKQLHSSLKNLQAKGIVNATHERPAQFSAITLEKVLDLLVKAKMKQVKALQASRRELLSTWRSMMEKNSANS